MQITWEQQSCSHQIPHSLYKAQVCLLKLTLPCIGTSHSLCVWDASNDQGCQVEKSCIHSESCHPSNTEILKSGRRSTNWYRWQLKHQIWFQTWQKFQLHLAETIAAALTGAHMSSAPEMMQLTDPWDTTLEHLQHLFCWSCDSRDCLSPPSLII